MSDLLKRHIMSRVEDIKVLNASLDKGSRAAAMLDDELVKGWVYRRVSDIFEEILSSPDSELPQHRATLRAVLALWADLCSAVAQANTAGERLAGMNNDRETKP